LFSAIYPQDSHYVFLPTGRVPTVVLDQHHRWCVVTEHQNVDRARTGNVQPFDDFEIREA
jgi:hypothetical protein